MTGFDGRTGGGTSLRLGAASATVADGNPLGLYRRIRAWSSAAARRFSAKYRLFAVMSLFLVASDALFIAINFEAGKRELDEEWEEAWRRTEATIDLAIKEQSNAMLMLARGYAADPEIVRLFLAGRNAVANEGGGPGGKSAARARRALYDRMAPSWKQITTEFRVRQLHFHIGPGSLSFLRVHKPERFGDRMDDLRHIIVDTIAEGTPRTGFETGRVYSGLRGVTPITAEGPDGERVAVGALEAGTSFETMMRLMDHALGAGVAVLLTKHHISNTMWSELVGKQFANDSSTCGCYIEARSRDDILAFVRSGAFGPYSQSTRISVVELDGRSYSLLQFPLEDYLRQRSPERPPVGQIVVWREVTERIDGFYRNQLVNIAFAVAALFLIEIMLYFGIRFISRARDAAETANRAKSNFLSTMSHEFRTPLNAIIGFSDALRNGIVGPLGARQLEYVENVLSSGRHLLVSIDRILQYQKIESRGRVEIRAAFDLVASVRAVLAQQRPAAAEAGIEVAASLPAVLVLHGNRAAVEQALSEILANALEVSPKGAAVRISLTGSGKEALLTVADGGPGFPPHRLAALARPFTKVQDAIEKADGFGMGLAIARALMDSQGGRLELENAPNGGGRVTLRFAFS